MAGKAATCDVSFVALTWNSESYVGRCLDSVVNQCASENLAFEFTVVDNGSRDGTARIVRKYETRYPDQVRLLALERNMGTTYSRNLALKSVRGPVVCVLDSDTEFLAGSIRPLLDLLAADENLAIVAPRLILPDGSVQHSVKRFPTLLDKLRKVPAIVGGRRVPRAEFYEAFPFDRCTRVESAISACWFFRTGLTDAVGMLDEGIFYSPEDVEYCARIHRAGLHVLYYPYLTLLHHTQQLTHRRPFSRTSMSHLKGLLRYHRRYGGWFGRPTGKDAPWPGRDDPADVLARSAGACAGELVVPRPEHQKNREGAR